MASFFFVHPLQYMTIHIESFPQSCIYGKYLLFANFNVVNPVTVLGAEQFGLFGGRKNPKLYQALFDQCKSWTNARFGITPFVTANTHIHRHP